MTPEQLLEPLDAATAAAYHAQVVLALGSPPIEVRDAGPGRGRGVFATRSLAAGDVVFRERALVAQQDRRSQEEVTVCSQCHRFIGSIEHQIAKLLRNVQRRGEAARVKQQQQQAATAGAAGSSSAHRVQAEEAATGDEDEDEEEQAQWLQRLQLLEAYVHPPMLLDDLEAGRLRLPLAAERFPLPPMVPCAGGCGERYCGPECRDAAWAGHHRLLCPGGHADGAATDAAAAAAAEEDQEGVAGQVAQVAQVDRRVLKEFLAQADETNDVFRLAAKLVAGVALRAAALLDGKLRSQRQRLAAEGAGSGSAAAGDGAEEEEAVLRREALREAWLPYAAGWKGKWWEAVAAPDDVRGADAEAEFRQQLRELAEDSAALLRAALPGVRAAWPALLHADVWGSVVGMFELNNLGLAVPSPVEDFFLMVHEMEAGEGKAAVEAQTQRWLDALDKWYDTGMQGTGFYAVHSCANHSCSPSVGVEAEGDGRVAVLALRDVRAGEELTINYLDEDPEQPLTYRQRQAALRDYGFTCVCSRCVEEQQQAARARARRGGVKVGRR